MKITKTTAAIVAAGISGYIVLITEAAADVSAKGLQVSLNIISKCRVSGGSALNAYDLVAGSMTRTSVKVDCSSTIPFNVSVALDAAPTTTMAANLPVQSADAGTVTSMRFYQDQAMRRTLGAASSGNTVSGLSRGQPIEVKIFGQAAKAEAEPVTENASDVMRVTVTY